MSDITSAESRPAASPLYLREEELKQGVALLFFAYSELFGGETRLLAEAGLGRAHRRALLAISIRPGITVSALLRLLRITKQSASRVLNELLSAGYLERRPAAGDRRRRELRLTAKGAALEAALWELQKPQLVRAFSNAGAAAVGGFREVLSGLATAEGTPAAGGGNP